MAAQDWRRTAQLAGVTAKAFVLQRWGQDRGRRYLIDTLAKMPGVPQKFGQLLATQGGMPVNQNLQPMPLSVVKELIAAEVPQLATALAELAPEAICASIAQVHRGRLHDGREVAIKVQYPGIRADMLADLDRIMALSKKGPTGKYGFDRVVYKEYLAQVLKQETDFCQEAQVQERFAQMVAAAGVAIQVPAVLPDLSSGQVLTQTYVASQSLSAAAPNLAANRRQTLAADMSQFLISCALLHGWVHTDLHAGNWGVTKGQDGEAQLVLYDYGSYVRVPDSARLALAKALLWQHQGRDFQPRDFWIALGFDGAKLDHLAQKLPALTSRLFEPWLRPGRYDPATWDLAAEAALILGPDKWWFRMAGPPWFLLMMRAIQGVVSHAKTLQASIPLCKIWQQLPLTASFAPADLAADFPAAPVTSHGLPSPSMAALAQHLWVEVRDKQSGATVVNMTLPARALDELASLIPEEALQRIRAECDLEELVAKTRNGGYLPGEVFRSETATRTYRVWLA